MTIDRLRLVITEKDLQPTRAQVRRFELAERIRRNKDHESARIESALPFRSFLAREETYLIHVEPAWIVRPNRLSRLRGFDLDALRTCDTSALWSVYVHQPDRLTDDELREYVQAAANMLVAKARWQHD